MRVVAYVRVSTDRQAEEGYGLDVQRKAIRQWAKANGHRVIEWCADEGVSGSNGLDTRLGLARAIEAVRERRAQGLVVPRLDRLARDLMLQEAVLADIRRHGGQTFSTVESESAFLNDDEADPGRRMIRQVLGSVAEYERAMIALRLKAGRALKAERGGYAYGAPPLGFRAEGGTLVADPTEQATLARVAELQAEGLSTREIGRHLEAEGYRTKRGGATWHPQTVARLIKRAEMAH